MNRPVADRMKRRALAPLQYDEADVRHFEILVGDLHGMVISVAGWAGAAARRGEGGRPSSHGGRF